MRNDENKDKSKRFSKKHKRNYVRLMPPWRKEEHFDECSQVALLDEREGAEQFIAERTRVHELFIREDGRTKRLTLVISALFLLCAFAMILFAPEGYGARAYVLSSVLLIFAGGMFGYKRIYCKTKIGSLEVEKDLYNKKMQ